ncbi:MAG: flippase [Candidatus Micrarchaeota archaeon]
MDDLSQTSKEVAKGTIWSLLGTLFFKLSSFFYVILIARVVSQDDIGILYLGISIAGLLSLASEFGIVSALVRYIPFFYGKNDNRKIFDLINFSYITVVLSVIAAIILFWQADAIAVFYSLPSLTMALQLFSIFIILSSFNKIFSNILLGFADVKSTQLASNLQNFSKLIVTICLFYLYGITLFNLVLGYILSFLPPVILLFIFMKKQLSRIPSTGDKITQKDLVNDVVPFGFMIMILSSFSLILTSADKLILGYLLDPSESASLIGIYSIAFGLAAMIALFPPTIGSIFFPVVSRLFGKNDMDGIRSLTETAQRWLLFITLPVAIVFLVFARDLLSLFYGESYASGEMVVIWYILGFVLTSITYVIGYVLAAMRLIKLEIKILAISALVNVILAFLLIPIFSIEGAALAIMFSSVVSFFLLIYYGRKVFNYSLPVEVYKLVSAFVISLIVLFLFKPYSVSLFNALPVFDSPVVDKILNFGLLSVFSLFTLLVFISITIPFKCFYKEDISLMKSLMKKLRIPVKLIDFTTKLASYGVKM